MILPNDFYKNHLIIKMLLDQNFINIMIDLMRECDRIVLDIYNSDNFEMEIKPTLGKFNLRKLKFVAQGIGYASISMINDHDIRIKRQRLPSKYR